MFVEEFKELGAEYVCSSGFLFCFKLGGAHHISDFEGKGRRVTASSELDWPTV